MNGDFILFDQIEVPQWYKDYLDSIENQYAGDHRKIFSEYGKRGGEKLKASKPADYYSTIGKMGGRGKRKQPI